jgi:hypothetical protein
MGAMNGAARAWLTMLFFVFPSSGWVIKRGGSIQTWKKRWLVLRGNTLYYFKKKEDTQEQGALLSAVVGSSAFD